MISCVCCPAKDGAFRRLIPEDPSGGWVHVVCALWLPEVTLGDTANVDKISVRDIPERNWNLTCYICTDLQDATLGACVQCDAGQCRKSFHVTCAQKYSLLETLEDSDMADPYFTYCKQHGSTDGHPKINGWAKWIRDRDGFLKKWQYDEGRKRTRNLMDLHQSGSSDVVGGEGLVEFFEHSYARFKHSQEQRIARERSELSRQYSIGYYLGNKIDKSRSRLEVISTKAEQALQERKRIELHTRNLLSSLLECANYLENVSAEQLEAPLSIDTTLALYNSLPDTSRWKSDIQGIIQTIDIDSLACDNPYAQIETQAQQDSGIDDSEGSRHRGRPFKGILGTLSKKAKGTSKAYLKNVKAKKVPPNLGASTPQVPVVLTSSRGRLIKRDNDDCNDYYSLTRSNSHTGAYLGDYSPVMSTFKTPKPIAPCTLCHQLTLPEKKLNLERDEDGNISPMAIKVLNRMVGYSWNCEDCDSSGESPGSGGESSPTVITHPRQNRHSSDLDEALMVLADTAMTVSAYQPHPPNKQPRGAKRTVTAITTDESTDAHTRATVMGMPASKHSKAKKAKTEADSPTWPKSIKSKDKIGCDDKDLPAKKFKANANTTVAEVSSQAKTMIPIQTSPVAPIIRGNLRIYPPGPHIAPKVDFSELQAPKVSVIKRTKSCGQSAKDFKAKAENTSVKMSKSRAGVTKIRNGNLESAIKVAKSVPKKAKIEAFPSSAGGNKTKKTSATAKTGMKKKTNKATPELEPHGKRNIKAAKIAKTTTKPSAALAATKEKPMTIQQGSLPDAPASAPKRKEIIRYTVGEKTVEELTARDDVEVERRENVKFRRLRGRTLTMPAPPQEWNEDGPGLTGISAATLATAPLPGL
ncbi:PHD finger protein 14 [Podila humilis]|nr:PHD finger protein 14 [Podila humilis]